MVKVCCISNMLWKFCNCEEGVGNGKILILVPVSGDDLQVQVLEREAGVELWHFVRRP